MPFSPLPEAARQAAYAQGTTTLHAVILDYAEASGGQPAVARLNQALAGIRQDAEATIVAEWPAVQDEAGLATLWALWLGHGIYNLGGKDYPLEDHTGVELDRAREIVDAAEDHQPALAAAQGAIVALKARPTPHPDDPIDPAGT